MKKFLIGLLAVLLAAQGFAGCRKQTQEKKDITLTVWGPQEDQANENSWLPAMCRAFAEENPQWNITFRYGVCSEGDAGNTVSADPQDAADVYFFSNDQLGALRSAGAISRLGGETLDAIKADNPENMVRAVTGEDGNVYGVPFTGNTWFLYYNKSLFSQEDILSLEAMLQKGRVAFPMTDSWYLAAFYLAGGAKFFGADGQDSNAGIQLGDNAAAVTAYLVELAQNPNFVDDAEGAGLDGLLNGSVGAMFSGTWDAEKIKKALGENYGAAQLPTITLAGEQKQLLAFAGAKAVGVNPYCKEPQAAVALARYLGSAKAQKAHYEMRGIVPSHKDLQNDPVLSRDPAAVAQNATIRNTSVVQPTVPKMRDFWVPGDNMGKAILAGSVTVENAAAETEKFQTALNAGGL